MTIDLVSLLIGGVVALVFLGGSSSRPASRGGYRGPKAKVPIDIPMTDGPRSAVPPPPPR